MNNNTDQEYEALMENYEDALMRIVMYRVAQEDGKQLLEEMEELENSGFEVPRELDEKCIKLIHSACAPKERKQVPALAGTCKNESPRRLRLYKVGRMLVVAILAAVLLFCVAYAANEQFRVNVLNFFLELRENGTQFFFGPGGSGDRQPDLSGTSAIDGDFPFEFTYIPEGFELIVQEVQDMKENGTGFFSQYERSDDEYSNFFFSITPISEGTGLFIDTEDAIITDVKINGFDGLLIQKEEPLFGKECCMYFWLDLEGRFKYVYNSVDIPQEQSREIFEGIVLNGQNIKIS